jgi:hypothetical protein
MYILLVKLKKLLWFFQRVEFELPGCHSSHVSGIPQLQMHLVATTIYMMLANVKLVSVSMRVTIITWSNFHFVLPKISSPSR